jgi:hypothetical protein
MITFYESESISHCYVKKMWGCCMSSHLKVGGAMAHFKKSYVRKNTAPGV